MKYSNTLTQLIEQNSVVFLNKESLMLEDNYPKDVSVSNDIDTKSIDDAMRNSKDGEAMLNNPNETGTTVEITGHTSSELSQKAHDLFNNSQKNKTTDNVKLIKCSKKPTEVVFFTKKELEQLLM